VKHLRHLLSIVVIALGISLAQTTSATVNDQASQQHGADLYMHYCSSCHSLKYLRYDQMAHDLDIPPDKLTEYLKSAGRKADDPIIAQLDAAMVAKAYGAPPPDLTLIIMAHSPDWLYQYLLAFYPDPMRPSGSNNHMVSNVAMPDVLSALHQQLGDAAFKAQVADLVSFLNYTAEPERHTRYWYGVIILIFLTIFLIPVILLHQDYWRDVE